MNNRPRIVIIGAGNVASHLAPALAKGADIVQVCATKIEHALTICQHIGQGQAITNLSDITIDADCYIMCVKDADIEHIAHKMPRVSGVVAHTSGSVAAHALKAASRNYGVLYPLQTFSKGVGVNVSEVPFFTEASNDKALAVLDDLAAIASAKKVNHIDSENRAVLHLAAVFACNFTNLMWGIAHGIMGDIGCSLHELEPLIRATLAKALDNNPADVQTGPAVRGDIAVMAMQQNMLAKPWDNIYATLSQAIVNRSLDQPILKHEQNQLRPDTPSRHSI